MDTAYKNYVTIPFLGSNYVVGRQAALSAVPIHWIGLLDSLSAHFTDKNHIPTLLSSPTNILSRRESRQHFPSKQSK